ncbi:MAG: type VII toxin-antitoxin system MntA family adenylyltransferase antitoxin [Blastocatellia bacterium]
MKESKREEVTPGDRAAPRSGRDDKAALLHLLQQRFPALLALYAFGSRVTGGAPAESDLDLAILVDGQVDPLSLFHLAGELAEVVGCDVDLVDFRTASTVMQYQILTTGERWWHRDFRADLYESMVLNQKTTLDEARAGLIGDILQRGSVHGR